MSINTTRPQAADEEMASAARVAFARANLDGLDGLVADDCHPNEGPAYDRLSMALADLPSAYAAAHEEEEQDGHRWEQW